MRYIYRNRIFSVFKICACAFSREYVVLRPYLCTCAFYRILGKCACAFYRFLGKSAWWQKREEIEKQTHKRGRSNIKSHKFRGKYPEMEDILDAWAMGKPNLVLNKCIYNARIIDNK